ncbi:MAG: Rid family detoxifying hydrolase [Bacteroidota bacterium]
MRTLAATTFLLAATAVGCRPTEEDVRRIAREELQGAMARQAVTSANVIGPYSPAVRIGDFLFVSGQIALDQETGAMRQDDIEVETHQVLANVMRILRSQDFDSSHVVSATVYLKNMNDYAAVNKVYAGYFQEKNFPARVAVEVADLPKQANVEIAVIAYRDH